MSFYLKRPQARVDYAVDWSGGRAGAVVTASSWAVAPAEPGGLAIETASQEPQRAAARVSGGLSGHVYTLSNRVTLSDGSVDEKSVTLRVEHS